MKVLDIMKREVRSCGPGSHLATVGRLMAEVGCGILPVLGEGDRVVGVITDRDLCLAVAERDRKPSDIQVRHVMSGEVFICRPHDDVVEALGIMQARRVRRLPVVNEEGHLEGLLSLDDVVLESKAFASETFDGPFYADIARTLRAICQHPTPSVVA